MYLPRGGRVVCGTFYDRVTATGVPSPSKEETFALRS